MGFVNASAEPSLEGVLDELVVLMAGRVAARGLPAQRPAPGDDEDRIWVMLCAPAMAAPMEAAALVELGRARARSMAERPEFIASTES